MKARAIFWQLHLWLGALSCLGLFLWAGSGLLHPIMARTQPVPAQRLAPMQSVDLRQAMPLPQALRLQGISHIAQAELASIAGRSYYRVQLPQQAEALYLATSNGQVLAQGDAQYAQQLARHYTALTHTPVRSVRLLTQFDEDYLPVNKLLPVWRVEFAQSNGLRAFVDTSQARLAALSDRRQAVLLRLFRLGHNWAFLDTSPKLQLTLMLALLACLLFSALSGLYFYWRLAPSARQRLQQRPWTRWHRRLGLVVSSMLLMAVGSGSYHLLHGWQKPAASSPPLASFAVAEMSAHSWMGVSAQPLAQLGLAHLYGQLVWLVQAAPKASGAASGPPSQVGHLAQEKTGLEHEGHEGHDDHTPAAANNTNTGTWVLDEHGMPIEQGLAQIARELAMHYFGQTPMSTQTRGRLSSAASSEAAEATEITRFNGEYGFFNKRLPVWRVQLHDPEQTRIFVEPATSALAARLNASDARESWSFINLHKWHFVPGGADVRDALLALFALGNLLVGGLGFGLFLRRIF